MTGNSLDGADFVLTRFDDDGIITDLKQYRVDLSTELISALRLIRECVFEAQGDMEQAIKLFADKDSRAFDTFDDLLSNYTRVIANGVFYLVESLKSDRLSNPVHIDQVDLIGFHGQTCAHYPPSVAKSKDPKDVYTVQIGDGRRLADLTGITVVYDYRSDDIINGGEGAPIAPIHHLHLAKDAIARGCFPLAFCNAGNTGNITIVTRDSTGEDIVLGWDTGPFNHFSDLLMHETGMLYDPAGQFGKRGTVNIDLLKELFDHSVLTKDGANFLMLPPPKSCDPAWYHNLPEVMGTTEDPLPFEERLCTAQYFAAYVFVHTLTLLPKDLKIPINYALCGGGWKNENIKQYFNQLLNGPLVSLPVLPEHKQSFQNLRSALKQKLARKSAKEKLAGVLIEDSEKFGYDGGSMEARLTADAAVCRIKGIPFTTPLTTGVANDTVLGIIRFPGQDLSKASPRLQAAIEKYDSLDLTLDVPEIFDGRWSRASAGWFGRLSQARPLTRN